MRGRKRCVGLSIRPGSPRCPAARQPRDHHLSVKSAERPLPGQWDLAGWGSSCCCLPAALAGRARRAARGGDQSAGAGASLGCRSARSTRPQSLAKQPPPPRAPSSAWVASARVSRRAAAHVPGRETARRRLEKGSECPGAGPRRGLETGGEGRLRWAPLVPQTPAPAFLRLPAHK